MWTLVPFGFGTGLVIFFLVLSPRQVSTANSTGKIWMEGIETPRKSTVRNSCIAHLISRVVLFVSQTFFYSPALVFPCHPSNSNSFWEAARESQSGWCGFCSRPLVVEGCHPGWGSCRAMDFGALTKLWTSMAGSILQRKTEHSS